MHNIEMVEHSDTQKDKNEKLDVLMTSCVNGVPRGVGCHLSPSWSNSKNINIKVADVDTNFISWSNHK